MKKITTLLLLLIMFSSCGNKKPTTLVDKIKAAEAKFKSGQIPDKKSLSDLVKMYLRFADSLPNDPKAPVCLIKSSDFYGTMNMHHEKIALYKKVLEKYPDFKDADMVMYLLASALDSDLDQRAEAKKYYELYIQKYPNSIYIPDATSRLTSIDTLSFKELQDKIIHQDLDTLK